MDDTISRQKAIDAVRELYIQSPKINNDIVYDMAIDQTYDALVSLPSAPQRTGKWLPEYGDANARAYYCSACNFYYTTSPEEMNYCPYCGAKMEKMPPLKVRSSKQTVIEKWQKVFERRHTYCRDCERSIYGKYADCDINIENKGLYVSGDCECRCKVKKEQEKTYE